MIGNNVEVLPDRKQLAEEQIGQAVAFLREKLPEDFILVAKVDGDIVTMGGFSLKSAQEMLKTAIEVVSDQYAYNAAKGKIKP